MPDMLNAGAAAVDITPHTPQFLFGYPHVQRISTGTHDPLLTTALYLSDGRTRLLLISNDVIFVSKASTARVRQRIEQATGVPAAHIMICATHTHSGPITVDMVSNAADPTVPKADPAYVAQLENGMAEAASLACQSAGPAQAGLVMVDCSCVGTNRHHPAGPANPQMPVLVVRDRQAGAPLAAMVVCSMHPTVLHEDSTLISGDFPAMTRRYLQQHVLGHDCPVVWCTGPCGDQSPRHVTRANTFAEASRLGDLLGEAIAACIPSIQYTHTVPLAAVSRCVELPRRTLPDVQQARQVLDDAAHRLAQLGRSDAPRTDVRTAECDLFGAEETLTLASLAVTGQLDAAAASVMRAEIQAMRIGPWTFVAWPGEAYVEFALAVRASHPHCLWLALPTANCKDTW